MRRLIMTMALVFGGFIVANAQADLKTQTDAQQVKTDRATPIDQAPKTLVNEKQELQANDARVKEEAKKLETKKEELKSDEAQVKGAAKDLKQLESKKLSDQAADREKQLELKKAELQKKE